MFARVVFVFLTVVAVVSAAVLPGGVHWVQRGGHRTLPEGPPQDPLQRREPSPAGRPREVQELQVGSHFEFNFPPCRLI